LLGGATGALVIAAGGRELFARFRASPEAGDGAPDPLDRYTRRTVMEALAAVAGPRGDRARAFFPFVGSAPVLPFQRLGRAAGLGPASPLGLQIHPVYGPWWAYRAALVFKDDVSAVAPSPAPHDVCQGCDAPCIAACPAGAVRREGFSVPACHGRRLADQGLGPDCRLSCIARIRCVRGPEHRYTDEQLAFHMAASMPAR
jgi:ferredoxin